MLVAAGITGIIILARPVPKHAKMTLWVFAESHQRSYVGEEHSVGEPPAVKYTRTTGNSLDVVQMNIRAEDIRVLSVFNTHGKGQLVPDAVEIEISKIGKFFRPPLSDIGLLPLNDFLKSSGWYDQVVKARFAPYSKQGVIFGVPHDLHPTGIAYRKDLFDEAGVDLESARTWPQFAEACREFKHYWSDQRHRPRWPIGLSKTSSDNIVIMLQERHINLVDDSNHIFINEPRIAQTVRLYADMVAGADPAGADFNPAPGMMFRDLANGDVCAMFAPRLADRILQTLRTDLAGKLALIPLPKFEPSDSPTASWGGTMIGIPPTVKTLRRLGSSSSRSTSITTRSPIAGNPMTSFHPSESTGAMTSISTAIRTS